MDLDHRTQLLDDAWIAPPLTINGKHLRKFSPTSFVILKRIGNRMANGGVTTNANGQVDLSDPDNLSAILEFIYVHSESLPKVLRSARDGTVADDSLIYCQDIQLDTLANASAEIMSAQDQTAAAMVDTASSANEDEDPNGHGQPG